MPSFGNQMGDDPLGIAVQGRAQQARQQFNQNEGWGHPSFGPLQDPKWAGLFQAMQEQGVDNVVGGGGPQPGAFMGVKHLPSKASYGLGGEIGPKGFPTATGQRQGPMMGYGAPDNRENLTIPQDQGRAAMSGLHQAYRPNQVAR